MYSVEKIWPEWKAVRLIGEGSSGKVYEIVRNKLGIEEHSALKVISVPNSQSEINSLFSDGMDEQSVVGYYDSIVQSFVSEISLMSKLKGHPNIVTYEDYQVVKHDNGIGYDILIRMELLTPFSDIIRQNKFDTKNILDFALQLCEALSVCHKNNILHRDIKYDNIFVSNIGTYKLGDFGVARKFDKTSGNFSLKGTYTYMAPEIYKGQAYGATSDIYSLGIVLYRLMNKNREAFMPLPPNPIRLDDKEKALFKRMSGEKLPAPVDASKEIASIILKACAFNQSERYSSADELKLDLLNYKNSSVLDKRSDNSSVVSDVDDDKTVSVFDDSDAQHIVYMSDDDKTSRAFDNSVYNVPVVPNTANNTEKSVPVQNEFIQVKDDDKTVAVFSENANNSVTENNVTVTQKVKKEKIKKNKLEKVKKKDSTDDTKKPKKKTLKIVLFVFLAMIVLVVVAKGIDSIINNSDSDNDNSKTTQSEKKAKTEDSYNEGISYFKEFAKRPSVQTMQKASECFLEAGDYENAVDYQRFANMYVEGKKQEAVSILRYYADDAVVQSVLETDELLCYFIGNNKWTYEGSYYTYCIQGINNGSMVSSNIPVMGSDMSYRYYSYENGCYITQILTIRSTITTDGFAISITGEDTLSVDIYELNTEKMFKKNSDY